MAMNFSILFMAIIVSVKSVMAIEEAIFIVTMGMKKKEKKRLKQDVVTNEMFISISNSKAWLK